MFVNSLFFVFGKYWFLGVNFRVVNSVGRK